MTDKYATYSRFELEPIVRVQKKTILSKDNPYIEDAIEEIKHEFIHDITALLYGVKDKPLHVTYPKDWWESVKDRFFPEWLLKRYPVQFVELKIEPGVIFPGLNIAVKRFGEVIPVCLVNGALNNEVRDESSKFQ